MKVEKFSYHFELSPSQNFQKATVGLTVDIILEEDDDWKETVERIKADVRSEVGREALSALEKLQQNVVNRSRDV